MAAFEITFNLGDDDDDDGEVQALSGRRVAELARAKAERKRLRREAAEAKLAADGDGDAGSDGGDPSSDDSPNKNKNKKKKKKKTTAVVKGMRRQDLLAFKAAAEKHGVCYLSRLPAYMRPDKLRHIMAAYGAVDRLYLEPESEESRARRVKNGGSKKTYYTQGWVQFASKRTAKRVAALLNTTTVGAHLKGVRSWYWRDHVWNIKYLRGFKWSDLTEEQAVKAASRKQQIRVELSQAKRESNQFLENVEQSKMQRHIAERRAKKKAAAAGAATSTATTSTTTATTTTTSTSRGSGGGDDAAALAGIKRKFPQRHIVETDADGRAKGKNKKNTKNKKQRRRQADGGSSAAAADSREVLSALFE